MTSWKGTRRDLIKTTAMAGAGMGLGVSAPAGTARGDRLPHSKADACIMIWLGGGAGHIDTFDPKRRGDPDSDLPGSYYDSIPTAVQGVRVAEHLSRTAKLLDRCVILRTVSHDLVGPHGAASNLMHTGRKPSGTLQYPSIGSVVSHELGTKSDEVPSYVVMGYPNIMRDPGFLGARHGYVYLTQTETGPGGLTRAPDVDRRRQQRREMLLGTLRNRLRRDHAADPTVQSQIDVNEQGFRMAGQRFMSVFNLAEESSSLREAYGGEFGQRCLLARRLVGAGVRFVEVSFNLNFLNGSGWDVHQQGILKQHLLIRDLDRGLAALIQDLEKHKQLDRTLIVVSTEFGRPPEFDSQGGRGHQSLAFSCLLAGGGLRTGQVVGETDELGKTAVTPAIEVPDLHATIHAALNIDPAKVLYAGKRPVPITDHGQVIQEVFS
jgi:hypothetical protein